MKKSLFGAMALVAMLCVASDANAFGRRGRCGGGGGCGASYGGCGQMVSYGGGCGASYGGCGVSGGGYGGQIVSYGVPSYGTTYAVSDGFSQQWQPSAPVPAYQSYQNFTPQFQQTQQNQNQQYQPGTIWFAGPDGILRQMNINQLQQQQRQNPASGERLVPSRKE